MKTIWHTAYSLLALPMMWVVVRILGLFNRKVRRGIQGRRDLFAMLEKQVTGKLAGGRRVWFHASSMGEFEQAKPIIAELKHRHPDIRIIATFFSPSGFEHSRKYPLADVISYIPFDTRANARRFLDLTRPDVAVIIRYDVWPNHIWELQRRNIPVLIANATMRQNTQRRFPLVRTFHYFIYNAIDSILTVSEQDAEAFKIFSLTHPAIQAIGDTRYDQVSIRSAEAKKRHVIAEPVLRGKRVLLAGSTWPEDEEVLLTGFLRLRQTMQNFLLIIVPHEPTIEHLEELEAELQGKASFIRFSALNDYSNEDVVIVDSIGILLTLYTYADVAFIGGSFKQNVHNVLEAAVYGIPVVYGPRHANSQEAVTLAESGGGFVVQDSDSLFTSLKRLFENEGKRREAGRIAATFVHERIGATEKFLAHLSKYL
ncbi:MAG: 3-deoxy-D-manno-octulosonic acid transferase [Bacteroidetes bacterium]|nr:3-deoxy-D-manno-octulosonic acid transferase [Bacteroidota bacterium]MCW5897598.1 3-deoxy-D-manno-octulosonic acid transferase [Bacteroidota bacterium]